MYFQLGQPVRSHDDSLSGAASPLPAGLMLRRFERQDEAWIFGLHERVFGPGRFARTAFRLRERASLLSEYCFIACLDGEPVGSVTLSRIAIGSQSHAQPGVLLGPLAVLADKRDLGIGKALLAASVEASFAAGEAYVLLVGDAPYYKAAGFAPVAPGRIQLPGPVDPARLLIALNTKLGLLPSGPATGG